MEVRANNLLNKISVNFRELLNRANSVSQLKSEMFKFFSHILLYTYNMSGIIWNTSICIFCLNPCNVIIIISCT